MKIQKIGIVGGGQLARMMVAPIKQMGMYVVVTDPTPDSPAGLISDLQIVGGYKDEKTIRALSKKVDVITIDAEFVNDEVLADLEKKGKIVHPSPKTIRIIKDKLEQKKFLSTHKIQTADFLEIKNENDLDLASEKFGFPFLLKARTDAYDGKGNFLVKARKDIKKGIDKLKGRALYAERYVPFTKELSVVIARSSTGEIKAYPVVETIHVDNICDTVVAPAQISKKAEKNAHTLASKTIEKLQGAGVFAIEMFLKKDDNVVVNEIAPRVHNSGHLTIEACRTSQFEQHIRAILGMPLGETNLVTPFAVMKNILGTKPGDGTALGIEKASKIPNVSVHMYGKKETRVNRKMGHITVIGDNLDQCLKSANKARRAIII